MRYCTEVTHNYVTQDFVIFGLVLHEGHINCHLMIQQLFILQKANKQVEVPGDAESLLYRFLVESPKFNVTNTCRGYARSLRI